MRRRGARTIAIARESIPPKDSPVPPAARVHSITGLAVGGRSFRFRKPIQVAEFQENGLWMHEHQALRILGYGSTREESWKSFLEDFASYWDGIAQEADSKLHKSAQAFKGKLLGIVEAVEPVS